ncbi:MAG: phosphoenolpyruvate carboxykinase (ATP) [Candidatus Cloacimonadaceae bacterium]|jgi:phosphoenolpyruvate carboxykinase (ATP)|nr:phosphoenolpyruvate carboxykinase (ATP) [Candidatus Cloacimonadota bacterium]MDD2718250.1 phosphoenolpyruvate carboxykinase (ATP) [Candidatus Cloacimonadota bacterium]MDD4814052.1 phosphoenolpyruvate carboxykinase (ATP) [Candidatus Cloacimonadota bacterium]MDD5316946.1 phosphoenolpyruvate carboxykinase (ATP) [Candidatus Cloacimonadota bacterium]MDY0380866.1 phosphoenolpyruvate carboxykinase (ATP) [Candidatus Cloacimonadaceae bacterium]
MASKSSAEYYSDLKAMSPIRAIAETLMNNHKVRKIDIREAYEMTKNQPGVTVTDIPMYPEFARMHNLPADARVLDDCHGNIIGRTAKARRFYHRLDTSKKNKLEGDFREAIYQMQHYPLIKAEAVLGMDQDVMIKATFITTESDVANVYNWLLNFAPYESVAEQYAASPKLPIQDIILIAFNEWTCDDPFYNNVGAPQLALVDEKHNVIVNLGMRYFGERKKGTLTMAWTSGIRIGMAACHGGIKEIDFGTCEDPAYHKFGKRSIAFYGLSGTGKSSHTNSHDNAGTLPKGFSKVVLHDDAFQIDLENKVCRAWEPTLFDKTDSRPIDHPDWKYALALMNHAVLNIDGKRIPVGQDLRNQNGRALLDRSLLGNYVNRCAFPKALVWLMKDSVLPPVLKLTNKHLAISMGAALMTQRNRAENVTEEELSKLVFEPFANPFRVYELYRDVEAFLNVADNGADFYCFNSRGYWKNSDSELEAIPLKTSLTLQTALLTDQIQWEEWDLLPGSMIPTRDSIEKILPGYYDRYDPSKRGNMDKYLSLLKDRFQQRINFLTDSDLKERPETQAELLKALQIKA